MDKDFAAIGKDLLEVDNKTTKSKENLIHSGIKGQKWGVRRYQKEDGTLTEEGKRRYGNYSGMSNEELANAITKKKLDNEYVKLQTRDEARNVKAKTDFTKAMIGTTGKAVDVGLNLGYIGEKQSQKRLAKEATQYEKNSEEAKERAKLAGEYGAGAKQIDTINKSIRPGFAAAEGVVSEKMFSKRLNEEGQISRAEAEALGRENLEQVVQRLRLEKEYDELVNPPKPSKVERGREVMQTLGAALGLVLTGLTIYRTVKGLNSDKKEANHYAFDGKYILGVIDDDVYLAHYRTKGSKNGVRRWQNEDGSLTAEGYIHYGIDPNGRATADNQINFKAENPGPTDFKAYRKTMKEQAKINKLQRKYDLKERKAEFKIQRKQERELYKDQRKIDAKYNNIERKEKHKQVRKDIGKIFLGAAAITGLVFIGKNVLERTKGINSVNLAAQEGRNALALAREANSRNALEKQRIISLGEANVANARFEGYKEHEDRQHNFQQDALDRRAGRGITVQKTELAPGDTASGTINRGGNSSTQPKQPKQTQQPANNTPDQPKQTQQPANNTPAQPKQTQQPDNNSPEQPNNPVNNAPKPPKKTQKSTKPKETQSSAAEPKKEESANNVPKGVNEQTVNSGKKLLGVETGPLKETNTANNEKKMAEKEAKRAAKEAEKAAKLAAEAKRREEQLKMADQYKEEAEKALEKARRFGDKDAIEEAKAKLEFSEKLRSSKFNFEKWLDGLNHNEELSDDSLVLIGKEFLEGVTFDGKLDS